MAEILSRFNYKLLGSILLAISTNNLFAEENRLIVAIIDTGVDISVFDRRYLCNLNHTSVTSSQWYSDTVSHCTAVANIITKNQQYEKMCVWIIKWFDHTSINSHVNIYALEMAVEIMRSFLANKKIDVINMSLSGSEPSLREYRLITEALEKGGHVVVAAGNDRINLNMCKKNKNGLYENCAFPASYATNINSDFKSIKDKKFHVVGCLPNEKYKCDNSNYGDIITERESAVGFFKDRSGNTLETVGTSISAAFLTNFIVKKLLTNKK